jgi:hypothetical protein
VPAGSRLVSCLPGGVTVAVLSPRTGPLISRFGPARIAAAAMNAYRPALVLITGVAALGAAVALTGLRPSSRSHRALRAHRATEVV